MDSVLVRKYGGSSLSSPVQIKLIAQQLYELHKKGQPLIVVVSAMGQTTNELLALSNEISPIPNRRELDMLLSTGERISMSLMCMALHELGCPAISFTGSQAGVLTDSSHNGAKIIDVKPIRVDESLKENKVVILAGFQGVNPVTKEITTLGRGGSDTTAVAMAAHFKGRCEIIKDVKGLSSADPKLRLKHKTYSKISYSSLEDICFWGAGILHHRSVSLAKEKNVPLFLGYLNDNSFGTSVCDSSQMNMTGQALPISVSSHKDVLICDSNDNLFEDLENLELSTPRLLQKSAKKDSGQFTYYFTDSPENLSALRGYLQKNDRAQVLDKEISSITLTFDQPISPEGTTDLINKLGATGSSVVNHQCRKQSFTAFIPKAKLNDYIHNFHKFLLQQNQ